MKEYVLKRKKLVDGEEGVRGLKLPAALAFFAFGTWT
jgi:hypothetical protein